MSPPSGKSFAGNRRRLRVYEAVSKCGIADRRTLADATGLCQSTVWRHLVSLEDDRLVQRVRVEYGRGWLWMRADPFTPTD